jgi:hypothetical protein
MYTEKVRQPLITSFLKRESSNTPALLSAITSLYFLRLAKRLLNWLSRSLGLEVGSVTNKYFSSE